MKKLKHKIWERTIYIALIIILVVYGLLKDSETASNLLKAISEAFSILTQNPL